MENPSSAPAQAFRVSVPRRVGPTSSSSTTQAGFRMAGRGCLFELMPYGDAGAIVVDMAREVLPVVRGTPVLAGVCGTEPFRLMDVFLRE